MTLLVKGVSKLSALTIDADKDWGGHEISSLKELALSMQKGDILIKGAGGVLIKLTPGPFTYELTSSGPGSEISWEPPIMP